MARGDFKADPREIIRAHRRTYANALTGKQSALDRVAFEGAPLALMGLCVGLGVRLSSAASAGLLTVTGILASLLFGVLVELSTHAMNLADSRPEPGAATSQHAVYVEELAANTAYASLVCIAAAITFVVTSISSAWTLRIFTALGLALSAHLALVLMMVMKRVFTLTVQQLNRARTRADLAADPAAERRAS